nr:histidine kinase [uncultured Blautia sp.]
MNFLASYSAQLENRISGMEKMLSRILYKNTDLTIIQSEDELTRHYACIRLQNSLSDLMKIDSGAEMITIAEGKRGICLDSSSVPIPFKEKSALREYTMDLAKQDGNTATQWEVKRIGDKQYLCKSSLQKHRVVVIFLSVDELMNTVPGQEFRKSEFFFTDADGMIYGEAGYELIKGASGRNMKDLSLKNFSVRRYDILQKRFYLYVCERRTIFYQWVRNGMVVLCVVVLLLYLFTVYMKREVKKELIIPMKELTGSMTRIGQGDYEHRVPENSGSLEFSMLSGSFNRLMDEIINLKIRNYEKKLELQEADQKYIKLQLRPHFFLNAMSTVLSLSMKGKNREIECYIQALSKNIRYMFSSGMYTVPVKEEIRHVQNYLEMQEFRYPNCVFCCIDLPKELEEWKIPQMLIHTLVENEYKYAVSRDRMLVLLIKVSMAEFEGEKMLLLEIEDDGNGYPEEVLSYMNSREEYRPTDGSRVGLWSIRRLLELMYDRHGLFLVSNILPHGALNKIYIPKSVVHEIRQDRQTEGI